MTQFSILRKVVVLFFFYSPHSFSQDNHYKAIDSLARTIQYKNDLRLLTDDLTKNYTDPLDKTRAIFIWITQNIGYDYKFVNKHKKIKPFKCKKNKDCQAKAVEWEDDYLKHIIRKGVAICDGYSRLFMRMCGYAGIQTSVVSGYTKQHESEIGRMGPLNHPWNVLLIDGKYYFFDATWASGYCQVNKKGKLEPFVRSFNDYYWLTPIDRLSRNHFPKDEMWLSGSLYTKEKYKNGPYIAPHKIQEMDILSPETGIIEAKVGDTIHFKIKDTDAVSLEHLQIDTNICTNPNVWVEKDEELTWDEEAFQQQKYVDYKLDNNIFAFDYVIGSKNLRYIDVLFDFYVVARFKVKIVTEKNKDGKIN